MTCRILAIGVALFAAGCSAIAPKRLDPPIEHTLFFDTEGQAADPTGNVGCQQPRVDGFCHGRQWSLRPQPELDAALYERQQERILAALREWGDDRSSEGTPLKIFLFVHGGLNSRSGSLGRATGLQAQIASEAGAYPLFINWRSSFLSSYGEHLLYLRQGKHLGWRALPKAPFYFLGDLARGIVRLPVVFFDETKNLYKAHSATTLNPHLVEVERQLEDKDLDLWIGDDCESTGKRIGRATESVATIPTAKLVTGAVLEGFGQSSWDVMLRRTDLLFYTEGEMRGERMIPSQDVGTEPQGDLALFLRELLSFLDAQRIEGRSWTIDLVGHSMGTIVVNDIIRYVGNELPLENIVYMAAACSLKDYQESVVPLLRARESISMYHLTLHPKADLRESNGFFLLPRGSLLVWLDDFLAAPATPFDRMAGRYDNLLRVMHLMPDESYDQVSIKALGVGSTCAEGGIGPVRHGQFGTVLRFWQPECWEPFKGMSPAHCFHQLPLPDADLEKLPMTLQRARRATGP